MIFFAETLSCVQIQLFLHTTAPFISNVKNVSLPDCSTNTYLWNSPFPSGAYPTVAVALCPGSSTMCSGLTTVQSHSGSRSNVMVSEPTFRILYRAHAVSLTFTCPTSALKWLTRISPAKLPQEASSGKEDNKKSSLLCFIFLNCIYCALSCRRLFLL